MKWQKRKRRVASINASRFVTRFDYYHTQNDSFSIRCTSQIYTTLFDKQILKKIKKKACPPFQTFCITHGKDRIFFHALIFIFRFSYHSMTRANLNKSKKIFTSTTTASNYTLKRTRICIIFLSNVFHNSHLIQKRIQNQQQWFRSVYKISNSCWFCIHFWNKWELWKTFDTKMIG